MKNILLSIWAVIFCCVPLCAQNTTVTGTVVDSDGVPWSYATITFYLYSGGQSATGAVGYTYGNWPLNRQVVVTANITGTFTATVADNTQLTPAGTTWYVQICSNVSSSSGNGCYFTANNLTISGPSLNLSSTINAVISPPRFAANTNAQGFADLEVTGTLVQGSSYYNVVTKTLRVYNGTSWANQVSQQTNGTFNALTYQGGTYDSLTLAWSAAYSQATSSGQNQTIMLGPGIYSVTTSLNEPTNGACISLIGAGGTTQQPYGSTPSGLSSTMINVSTSIAGSLFTLVATGGTQAQSCTFRDFTINGNDGTGTGLQGSGFNFDWFRGLSIENVTVNDTGAPGIILGETSGSHQANFYLRNVVISYSYNGGSGYTPASRPAYGLQINKTAIDSNVDTLFVRNAATASVYVAASTIFFTNVHGFGYPYSCGNPPCNNHTSTWNAANASYATDYIVQDIGGQNIFIGSYLDSPAIAGIDVENSGSVYEAGKVQWPDTVSFPAGNLAYVNNNGNATSGIVITNFDCINMNSNANWITYANTTSAPSYSTVWGLSGCGSYVQGRIAARQTAFDIGGANSSNTNFGTTGVVPKVFVTPLSTSAAEGGIEAENYGGGNSDTFYSGYSANPSNFAVRATGSIKTSGLQTAAQYITGNATLTVDSQIVVLSASSSSFTVTLPSCYTPMVDGLTPTGMRMDFIRADSTAYSITLASTSSELFYVNGVSQGTSFSVARPQGYSFVCGSDYNWYLIAQTNSSIYVPHLTWHAGYFAGTFGSSANNSLGATWTLSVPINVDRLDVAIGTAPAGCTTYPVIGIYNTNSASWVTTLTLSAGTYTYHSIFANIAVSTPGNFTAGVQTAGVGCTTFPAAAQLTMDYTVQ